MLLKSIDKTISSASELYQSYKRPIILFFILIIFSYVLYYIYNAYVLPLLNIKYSDNKEFDTKEKGVKYNLHLFYANWCPHCIKAKPQWQNLKNDYHMDNTNYKKIRGNSLYFIEHDCTDGGEENNMDKYGVEGFPTVILEKGNDLVYFDAKPTYDNLVNFLQTNV